MEPLKRRCKRFTDELNIKVALFCDSVGIGRSTYYKWLKGEITISDELQEKLDAYISKYGF